MLHINTRQIDNHCWQIDVVEDGYQSWNASLDGKRLRIRKGESEITTAMALITDETDDGMSEEDFLGAAVALVGNWVRNKHDSSVKRDPAWGLTRALTGHMAGFDGE